MSRQLLSAEEITREAGGKRILGPLSLGISRGDLVVVIGPNGAGKTTLLRLLAGILEPTNGVVRLDERPLSSIPRRHLARRLAHLPQQVDPETELRVRDAVGLGRFPYRSRLQLAPSNADRRAVDEALERLELTEHAERRLATLSGGERQLALLATALAQEAEIWLLDEPTTHLDPRFQRRIGRLLAGVAENGRTLVVATHDLELATFLGRRPSGRVVALREGVIAADGPPGEVLTASGLEAVFETPFVVGDDGTSVRLSW